MELGKHMAYRGESSEMMAVAAQGMAEFAPAEIAKPTVGREDLSKVRLAIGMTAGLAIVDLCLYLPRLF